MTESIPPPTEADTSASPIESPQGTDQEETEEDLLDPDAPRTFDDFDLSDPLRQALEDVGYEAPMTVQSAVWMPVRAGRDIQVESRTGSGKTAAFGLPMIEKLTGVEPGAAALILAPTRELAKQVADELTRLSVHTDVTVAAVYGGAAMGPQITALKDGVKIIAGTPGRVLDHIRRGNLKTDGIKTLVLDECDEMLSMGFAEEIDNIIGTLPPREERQTLLFSATIPDDIVRIAKRHMTEPVSIALSQDGIGAAEIEHFYYLVNGMARTRDLLKLVLKEKPESAIIFCNTRDDAAVVARNLAKNGFDAEAISGDLSQRERERVMSRMREQNLRFLVATDIAARGIDISNLSHVINYQFPESAEVYVHRTGRTGRAGKTGIALSLVGPREIGSFYYLKLIYKIRPEERDLPPTEELKDMLENHQLERVNKLVTENPNEKFLSLAKKVWESEGGERIVGALLERLLVAETSVERDRSEKRDRDRDRDRDRGRSRSRRRDRDGDGEREPRRRRRRRDRDGEGEREESAVEAKSENAEAAAEDVDVSEDTEASTDNVEASENGEARKKRRRRRRRGGRDRDKPAKASADDGREFWETWADEKSDGDETEGDEGSADDDGEEAGDGPITARLYVNIGKREDATADDIRELIGGLLGEDADKIGSIALRNTHSYVRVPDELVDGIIKAAEGQAFKERELLIERARR